MSTPPPEQPLSAQQFNSNSDLNTAPAPNPSPPANTLNTALPNCLAALQSAFHSPDPYTLPSLLHTLIGPMQEHRFTSITGPDSHPLMLGTLALFCWGAWQSNIMIEETLCNLLRLHGMNPSYLISQTQLQPLLESGAFPATWLRPTSNFYRRRQAATPLSVPLTGILHQQNHFITIYISKEYWTISDPLTHSPALKYNIDLWEHNIHSALRSIHSHLNLPQPPLTPYKPLTQPLSVQNR